MSAKPFAPVDVAVVGVGALGEHHARLYSGMPGVHLTAVVDIKEDRANKISTQYGCAAFSDYHQVLDKVEAVSLAVPTRNHAAIGREFLERGIHVLVEKPIADSLKSADILINASERKGALLHVGHSERFNPAFQAVRPFVIQPQFFEAHRLGIFVPRSLDIDVVLDLMIHDLDLILQLSRSGVKEIRSVGIPVLTSRIDIANARVEFVDGCVANITSSRVSNEKVRKLRFFQPHDYISVDFHHQQASMYSLIDGPSGKQIIQRKLDVRPCEPLRVEIEVFLDSIRNKPASVDGVRPCTGEEGKEALSLALEILGRM
ncbi:MAG: Gfo/Idh/MocA family oxidoreductase [Acidobacteria bacterium]|nr:Gfo/Idh/MocA family oxidoreductase [Acidobacteriota bacterium]